MENNFYMCKTNGNIKENLEELRNNGYNFIVKVRDNWLSVYSPFNKKHLHLIACKNWEEREKILEDVKNDKTFSYINWSNIEDYKSIYNWTRGKTYTIRNDWSRAFNK